MSEEAKSYIRTLSSGSERLQFLAIAGKGSTSFYVLHQEVGADKKVKTKARGATQNFPNLAEAQKAVDAGVAQALTAGWEAPKVAGGLRPKAADTFTLDALPKPGVAKSAPAPTKKEAAPQAKK